MNNSNNHDENSEDTELPKLPFKRLKYALKQIVEVAIPLHVQLLKQHIENIEVLKKEGKDLELRFEQVKATKTVQLLKADLYELENLNQQVKEEDSDLFHDFIKNATKDAVETLALFVDLHGDIFTPLPEAEFDDPASDILPPLVCNYNEQIDIDDTAVDQIQALEATNLELVQVQAAKSKYESLNFLHKELLEINALIKQFSRFIFRQKEAVDTIQEHIEQAKENALIGTVYLKKASDYKAATLPIAGAVIGGLILGPVGALAGLKILGSVACLASGSIIGYGAGVKLKKRQLALNEFEMKALTDSNKALSQSSPDLSVEESKEKDKDL